jgi:putative ABC transport system substrate-binding protein
MIMNKYQVFSGIVGLFLALAIAGLLYYVLHNTSAQKADFRIAIFEPVAHPAIEEIARGFKETIVASSARSYFFDEYNANGNSTLLRAQADEIMQRGYDLVFTIGVQCSQTIHELTNKRQSQTPQVFSAIDDPGAIGIVPSCESSQNTITGVLSTSLYKEQIDALLRLKPTVTRILLVYNPGQGTGFAKDRAELAQIAHAKNISLHTVEVAHHNEIAQKVPAFLSNTDVVLVLTDNTVVSGIDSLITLCNRYGVLLYASDLNSGDKGAALSFGVREYDYGVLSAQLAQRILEDKQLPCSVAIKTMDTQYLKINTKTMHQQGFSLTEKELERFKAAGGIYV